MEKYQLLSEADVAGASDDQLAYTIDVLVHEQKARALAAGDLEAVAEEAFATWGFNKKGEPSEPRIINGLLVCPGYKYEKSAQSHDCGFVSVEGTWVWEHPDLAYDEMRETESSKKTKVSVSIVPVWEGLEYDVVHSSARSGPCRMKKATSYKVAKGAITRTQRKIRERSESR